MRRYVPLLLLLLTLAGTYLVYQSGLTGSFVFDDKANILGNSAIAIRDIHVATLWDVGLSSTSGPLRRPISMISFALNYFTTGADPYYFKLSNLAIHLLNEIAIFCLSYTLVTAYRRRYEPQLPAQFGVWLSLAVSAAWGLHPFNLTGVLYVVQRMTSLSTLFTLIGLTLYTWGRIAINAKKQSGLVAALIGLFIFTPLATLCKENGALLPLLALVIELIFFKFETGNAFARRALIASNIVLIIFPALVAALFVVTHPHWLMTGYTFRDFNMTERVLTECRVMWFYLHMIVLPQFSQMGLFHDDIAVSRGLFEPITTFFSILGLIALIATAWITRRKAPVISFGIAFFFIGHLVESTIVPLEITFEHRNYLPSFGILFAVFFYLLHPLKSGTKPILRQGCAILLIGMFAFGTYQRSLAWSDRIEFARSEVTHHPHSARDAQEMGNIYAELARADTAHAEAYKNLAYSFFQRASENDPNYTGGLISILMFKTAMNETVDPKIFVELKNRLQNSPPAIADSGNLINLFDCVQRNECHVDKTELKGMLDAALENRRLTGPARALILSAMSFYLVDIANDYPAALAVMYQTVESAPQELTYRLSLVRFLRAMQRFSEAREQLAILKSMDHLHEYSRQIADAETSLANTPKAVQH